MIGGPGDQHAVLAYDPGIGGASFGDEAVFIHLQGLEGTGLLCLLLGQHIGQQGNRLDVAPLPADIGHRYDGATFFRQTLCRPRDCARRHHQGRLRIRWEGMVPGCHAAGDLEIQGAGSHAVATHGLTHDMGERPLPHGRPHGQGRQRPGKPVQMGPFIHQVPPLHPDHLVDAVGELEATVLDMNGGLPVVKVTAIYVGDS